MNTPFDYIQGVLDHCERERDADAFPVAHLLQNSHWEERKDIPMPFRIGKDLCIEYNPVLIQAIRGVKTWSKFFNPGKEDQILKELKLIALQLLLKHPLRTNGYRKSVAGLGSMVTIAEQLKNNAKDSKSYDVSKYEVTNLLSDHPLFEKETKKTFKEDLCYEDYLSVLERILPPDPTPPPSGGGQGQGQGDQNQQNQGNGQSQGQGQNQPGGQGQGQGQDPMSQYMSSMAENWGDVSDEAKEDLEERSNSLPSEMASRGIGSGSWEGAMKFQEIECLDYATIVKMFSKSIGVGSNKRFTRTKPNRRLLGGESREVKVTMNGQTFIAAEDDSFGSTSVRIIPKKAPRALIAFDTSGSVPDKCIEQFLGITAHFLKSTECVVDVVLYDYGEITEENIIPFKDFKSAVKSGEAKIVGRGGTDFQAPIDYAIQNRYDGIIYFTDGYAPYPTLPKDKPEYPISWVLCNKTDYESFVKSFFTIGKNGEVKFPPKTTATHIDL